MNCEVVWSAGGVLHKTARKDKEQIRQVSTLRLTYSENSIDELAHSHTGLRIFGFKQVGTENMVSRRARSPRWNSLTERT